jgi:glycosyltransferase involved in cell wall biosynthesis
LVKLGCDVVVLARRLPGQPQFEIVDDVKVFRIWRGIFKPVSTDSPSIVVNPALGGLKLLEKVYFNTVYLAFTSSVALYLANEYKVDVILERGDSYGAGAIASLITGMPLITEIRDIYQPRISLRVAKRLLVYDPSILRDKRLLFKVAIMRGGVDVKKFKPMPKQDAKISLGLSGKFVIGYSGSSMKSHKLGVMVTLAEKLQKTYGDRVHFLVIGPRDHMLLKTIIASGLEHNFSFVGPVLHDELPRYINAMDVGLAIYDPKKVAGPPYKVYEYMACGVPVITTETVYSRRIIRDGLNGFLVKANNYEDILRKILLLIEDSKLLHGMNIKARETALKFSWEKESKRTLKLLMSCCENSGDDPRSRSTRRLSSHTLQKVKSCY